MMRRFTIILVCITLTISILWISTALLMPKYISNPEGRLISEYYREADVGRKHTVIFLGDCEIYESFIPPLLWECRGITSFIRGSAGQTITQSRYLLEEVLGYETPDIVVLGVYGARYTRAAREEYNRMTLDGMRWSGIKREAVRASMLSGESALSYYFPLLRFHSRWKELGAEDIRYAFSDISVSHNGYLLQTGVVPADEPVETAPPAGLELAAESLEEIRQIERICRERGIRLILVKAPVCSQRYWWYDEWNKQVRELADELCVDYYNFLEYPEIGIDMRTDSYDGGTHLNVFGAEKLTRFFGEILSERYGAEDKRENGEIGSVWNSKLEGFKEDRGRREKTTFNNTCVCYSVGVYDGARREKRELCV